jgi:hypothetical protein
MTLGSVTSDHNPRLSVDHLAPPVLITVINQPDSG